MAANTAFGIQHIVTNGSAVFSGMQSTNYEPRLEHVPEASNGSLHQTAHHFLRAAQRCVGQTKDLGVVNTLYGGNADTPSFAITAWDMYAAEQSTTAPGYLTTSSHTKFAATTGHSFLDSITWDGGLAMADFSTYFISSDGETDPVTQTNNNALPTQDVFTEGYSLFSLTVGGSALENLDSLTITINHGAENNVQATCYDTGKPYPKTMAMPGAHGPIEVICEIAARDISVSPANGDVVAVFKERASGGFFGSNTVTVTINGIIENLLGATGSTGSPMNRGLVCRGHYDGTNKPITLS